MYTDLQVEYTLFLSDFNEILLSGSQVVPNRQTDMMKLVVPKIIQYTKAIAQTISQIQQ